MKKVCRQFNFNVTVRCAKIQLCRLSTCSGVIQPSCLKLGSKHFKKPNTSFFRYFVAYRSDIARLIRTRRKAELEVLSSLTFSMLPPPFGVNSLPNTHAKPDLLQTWTALENGPLIIPFVISKLSEYLPPLA